MRLAAIFTAAYALATIIVTANFNPSGRTAPGAIPSRIIAASTRLEPRPVNPHLEPIRALTTPPISQLE